MNLDPTRLLSASPLGRLLPARSTAPFAASPAGVTYDGIPRMPALFGRQGGPRQRLTGSSLYPASAGDTLATWAVMRVDEKKLSALLPEGFVLADNLLIVEAVTLSNLPWLAGRGYEMLMVSTPVVYTAGGVQHRGRLELVSWEDRPDAIISGREELGWNKIYADTMDRHTTNDGKSIRYTVAWGGTTFFELSATLGRGVASLGEWRSGPLMHYRVFPRTGDWGTLEVEQVTAHAAGAPVTSLRQLRPAEASFKFIPSTFEQLPTLVHIVNKLADLTTGEVVDAGQARTATWGDVRDIKIISSTKPLPFVSTETVAGDDEQG